MHRSLVSISFIALQALMLPGCGGDDAQATSSSSSSSSNGGFTPYDICAEQHLRDDKVIVCDKPFDAPPYVHLPPAGGLNDYMVSDCTSLWDRDGNARSSIQGPPCEGFYVDEAHLHAFSIYEVTLCGDSIDGPCGAVNPSMIWQFARFAVIDEKAFLAPMTMTSAEGKISAKKMDGTFELDPTLPVRVTFGAPTVSMAQNDGTSSYRVDATIDNLMMGTASADGNCMAPLSMAAAANPFGASTKTSLTLTRVPSMHVAGDDEGVVEFFADDTSLGSDMNPAWFIGPKDLINDKPLVAAKYEGFGHGTPGSIPNITLEIVKGGGATCTPWRGNNLEITRQQIRAGTNTRNQDPQGEERPSLQRPD